ncbi:MAG TPA: hypothetical protein VM573_10120, partial [Actinomycetota bacterium]|nr:hypothetical protein [Actinomycetota bacterium]
MNHLRSWIAAGAAALLLASACSPTDDPAPLPSTAAAADRFLEAWSEGDMATVSEMMSVDSATEWPVERLDRWWQRRLDEGAITEAVFTREGEPEQPSPSEEATPGYPPVEVGYRVTYSSDAAAGDVLFDGTLRLVFDAEQTPASPDGGERWAVAWEP